VRAGLTSSGAQSDMQYAEIGQIFRDLLSKKTRAPARAIKPGTPTLPGEQ
jgi:hypothetical protein